MDKLDLTWRKSSRSNANGGDCVEVAEVAEVDRDDRHA
jgi:hypothetical protein